MQLGKIIGLALLGLSLALSTGTVVFADGGDATLIHARVLKDGTMRIVGASTACKSNETALHWATSARIVTDESRITATENKNTAQDTEITAIKQKNTQQDSAISALQNSSGPGACVIKDSQDKVVGEKSDCYGAIVSVSGGKVWLPVGPNGFVNVQVNFYHTEANCAGTRYLFSQTKRPDFPSLMEFAQGNNGKAYFSSPDGPFVSISEPTSTSVLLQDGSELCSGPTNFGQTFFFGEVRFINFSDLDVVPPLRLE